MNKIILLFLLLTLNLFSQNNELKIIIYDTTEDYWKDYYEKLEKDIEEMTVKYFVNHKKIQIYYKGDWRRRVCNKCKHPWRYIELKDYILYSTYEINNYSYSYGKFRGIKRFNNWYFFKLLDWYEIRYEDYEKQYNVYIYNRNDEGEILYSGAGQIIAKIRFTEFKSKRVKAIDFYCIYNKYMENYSFTIIFKNNCEN